MGRGSTSKVDPREGPKVFRRGRWYGADFRVYDRGRITLRDPKDPGWPERGERTEHEEVAHRWKWAYVDLYRDGTKRKQLGLPQKRRLRQAVGEFLAHRETHKEPNTWRSNVSVLNRFLERFKNIEIHEVTKDALQEWLDEDKRAGYADSTIQTQRLILSAFFSWAGDYNPASQVVVSAPGKQDIHTFGDDVLTRIREAADWVEQNPDPRVVRWNVRLGVELALATGARSQELFALEWRDINPKSRTVRIDRQQIRDTTRTKPLKGKTARTAVVLPSWWDYHTGGTGRVLRRADGRGIGSSLARRTIDRLLKRAGQKRAGAGWHDFRRTYGRLFLEAGGWMDELQRSLGHASIRTTEASYGEFQGEVAAQFATQRIYGEGRLRLLR